MSNSTFTPSKCGDVFVVIETVRALPFDKGTGFNLEKGEIVVSMGAVIFEDDNEKVYFTRLGLGLLPEDHTFYSCEVQKI